MDQEPPAKHPAFFDLQNLPDPFQSIQHALVDAAVGLEAARGLVVRAAAVEADGGDADALSTMAKLAAAAIGLDPAEKDQSPFGLA